jgi:hypothetical protein
MDVTPAELRRRMSSKSRDELRAIVEAPTDQYTTEARNAAAVELHGRPATTDNESAAADNAPASGAARSLLPKLLMIVATLAVMRQVVRFLSRLFFP